MFWRKVIACIVLYGAMLLAIYLLCLKAPFDPQDSETRDDEK